MIKRIRTCSVHVFLREVCLRKSKEENFFEHDIRKNGNNLRMVYLRRLGLSKGAIFPSTEGNIYNEPVRSLIISHCDENLQFPSFRKFRLLRVFDALVLSFVICDDEMFCSLVHLRYFALTCCCCSSLTSYGSEEHPEFDIKFIGNLKNLETLVLKHECNSSPYSYRIAFPILELPKLRHFVLVRNASYWRCDDVYPPHYRCYYIDEPFPFPGQGICLDKLQTISGVNNLILTSRMVQSLKRIVKLKVEYVNIDLDYCFLDQLAHLHHLQELSLEFNHYRCSPIFLPRNITIPDGLKKLSLDGLNLAISSKDMSVFGSLPNLEVLKMTGEWYGSKEWKPIEGEFQQLKYLKLHLRRLKNLKIENIDFPILEQLIISNCGELEEVPMEVGEIETLRMLVIQKCRKSVGESARKIQKQQLEYGNILEVFVEEGSQGWEELFGEDSLLSMFYEAKGE